MLNCQQGSKLYSISILSLQNPKQFLLHSRKIKTIQLPQQLQQIFDCFLQGVGIYSFKAIALSLENFARSPFEKPIHLYRESSL
ncbi:hypothetical protein LC593_28905 [Nostoc sp. CHAB 5844]|nr:hypothetical protein [Nostoc sp. CHAB 5844]